MKLKILLIIIAGVILLPFLAKIIWMNATPGFYHSRGCCSYEYMTREEIIADEAQDKASMCALMGFCRLENDPGYILDMFLNNFDFNK